MAGYKISNQHAMHYLTLTTVGWVDVFTRKRYCNILLDSLAYCRREKGLILYAYVIMSNHLHLIAQAKETSRLSDILRDFKKFTSAMIIKSIQEEPESRRDWLLLVFRYYARFNKNNSLHQLWQHDNHPIELYSPDFTYQRLAYIHQNPVRAGWVEAAEQYRYSSALDYAGGKGLLDISVIDIAPTIGYVHVGDLG